MNANTQVWKIMSADLETVAPDTSIAAVKSIFGKNNFHHLPVEDNLGEIMGIITESDLMRADRFPSDFGVIQARHIMTASVETIKLDTTIKEAMELFLEKNFRALPVLDKSGVFVGLITTLDLLRCMPDMIPDWHAVSS